jgi:dihydroneopterin aldolase
MNSGEISILGLALPTRIGVPEEERAGLQVLLADITVSPGKTFAQMKDEVSQTIDYAALALRLQACAMEKPRRLLETLADEMAEVALREFQARRVKISLRKKILPGVEAVAVSLEKAV